MAAEQIRRVQELFDAALALSPGARAAFLAQQRIDAELRAEVESLLAAHEATNDSFMRPDTAAGVTFRAALAAPDLQTTATRELSPTPHAQDPLVGRTVGKYLIKSVIATGGMGTVYKAVQDNPRRTVALKVMHSASPSAMRRFQLEAEVLGRLQHPNIAHVYEAGTHEDREGESGPPGGRRVPYFAMELVEGGRPITEYAAARRLGLRERLALFLKVCDAVQHGHTKGIVHRDLKPANLLVDAAGEPKVIDFGVARATDADVAMTTQTSAGDLIGTLQYMSPEQCDGDAHNVDTRSDVYSLGVVLYELLTRALPYDAGGSTIYHAVRTIRETEPRRPSSLGRPRGGRHASTGAAVGGSGGPVEAPEPATAVRGDVETIMLKALEKNREGRYGSVADLSRDIQHYLNGEPIEARPTTRWVQAMQWMIRNPVLVTSAACLIVVTAFFGGSWATNRFYWAQPDRLVLSEDQRVARLISRGGSPVRQWEVGSGQRLSFAELAERPTDGQILALIGLPRDAIRGDFLGRIAAFDARRIHAPPRWVGGVQVDDLLQPEFQRRGFVADEFNISSALVAEIFAERDGPEVVVIFDHDWSRRLTRIYSFDGEPLFSFWHDGSLAAPFWWEAERLLVFTASDDRPNWNQDRPRFAKPNPHILMAIRPRLGAHLRDYVLYPANNEPEVHPEWCRRLLPERLDNESLQFSISLEPRSNAIEWTVNRAALSSARAIPNWGFIIGVTRNGSSGSSRLTERYRLAYESSELTGGDVPPDPNDLKLVPWPSEEARRAVQGGS